MICYVSTSKPTSKDTKMLAVRVPAALDKRLEMETIHADMTKQALVVLAIESYLTVAEAAR